MTFKKPPTEGNRKAGGKIQVTPSLTTTSGERLSTQDPVACPALQSRKILCPRRPRIRAILETRVGMGSSGEISADTSSKLTMLHQSRIWRDVRQQTVLLLVEGAGRCTRGKQVRLAHQTHYFMIRNSSNSRLYVEPLDPNTPQIPHAPQKSSHFRY